MRGYRFLWPVIIGVACAYTGLPTVISSGFCGAEGGLFTDGATMAALGALLIVVVPFSRNGRALTEERARKVALFAATAEFAGVLALGALRMLDLCSPSIRFVLDVAITIAAIIAIGSWLRQVRGADATTSAVLVFSALFVAEIPAIMLDLLPEAVRGVAVSPLLLFQIYLFGRYHAEIPANASKTAPGQDDYYAFILSGAANRRFLIAGATGLAAISLVSGFLCGFSGDEAIVFGVGAEIARFLLTETFCVAFIAHIVRGKRRVMGTGIWLTMEFLAGIALVLYSAFPNHLEIGGVAATMLTAVMTLVVWHLSLAFMAVGWREPLYYVVVIWGIWAVSHGLGRFVLTLLPMHGDSHFTGTLISLLLLISTQIILVKLIDVAQFAAEIAVRKSTPYARAQIETGSAATSFPFPPLPRQRRQAPSSEFSGLTRKPRSPMCVMR